MKMRPFIALSSLDQRINGRGIVIDSVPLSKILELNYSPIYVTSLNAFRQRIKVYKEELSRYFKNNEIFYAMKANFAYPILAEVKDLNTGIDIVSIGEWKAATQAGISPNKICFAGVGKKQSDWKEAILNGLGFLSVEHLLELEEILYFIMEVKNNLRNKVPIISLRLNPALEIETHPHLKTGSLNSKFGILFEHFQNWFLNKKESFQDISDFEKWIAPLRGVHVHVGSQLMENTVFPLVIKKILQCCQFLFDHKIYINFIDFGGGLGVSVQGVPLNGQDIQKYISFISTTFINEASHYPSLMELWQINFSNLFVCLEPGRSTIASSTIFLTQVLYKKENSSEHLFCYVDGAMNDFPRPSIYDAKHHCEIVNFTNQKDLNKRITSQLRSWNIVGPICESGDFLSKNSVLSDLEKGDWLAFFEAGAYCRSMASNYNLRPFPAELFVKDGKIISLIH